MIRVSIHATSRFPADRKRIRECVIKVLHEHHIQEGEVSVSLVGARRMKFLNEELMKHEGVTDVLSFPQYDPEQPDKQFPTVKSQTPAESAAQTPLHHFGDVVVCYPVARSQAAKKGKMVDDEICFLVDHSMHHLLGFHHD